MKKQLRIFIIVIFSLTIVNCKGARKDQKETAYRVQAAVIAIDGYRVDHKKIPSPKSKPFIGSISTLRSQLEPIYIKANSMYWEDSWYRDIIYYAQPPDRFWVVSYGADGRPDNNFYKKDGWPIDYPKRNYKYVPEN